MTKMDNDYDYKNNFEFGDNLKSPESNELKTKYDLSMPGQSTNYLFHV